ncbi:multidrug transporter EmrE-like cation transporter [Orbus hercynius]|uniref:Multidrug transporter EmrE-like cation transporter n=1 Tax=Orbus hercynius TaxID=593135 RepID=A0A495RFB1_9GAMM|nr:EamA family transporter [Orbus hercynius]RKS86085.1 multidrug transporter EmrE-like cation transporter [Orbus hercynius]
MRKFYLIGFALLLFFDTVAHCSFKMTALVAEPLEANTDWLWRVFSQQWVYLAIFGYILTFFTWMTLLRKAPIGPAFAASHLEVVTVMIASVWLFNEQITLTRILGALFIVTGIIFLAFAEKQILEQSAKRDAPSNV